MSTMKQVKRIAGWLAAAMVFAGTAAAAEKWDGVDGAIGREATRAADDARLTESLIGKDRSTLMSDLSVLKQQIASEQAALDGLKAQFEKLGQKEVELKKGLESEHKEVADVEGSVRGALKEAVSMVRDNPITAETPARSEKITAMVDSTKFPGMAGIETLVNLYFDELSAGGKVARYTGEFIGTDGKKATGEIIRAGRFTGYYKLADGKVGFLKQDADGNNFIAVVGEMPRAAGEAIESFFEKKSNVLPVDPSGGAVFSQMTKKIDLMETMHLGGVVMWPILFVAAIALLLTIERVIVLGSTKANSDRVVAKLSELAGQGKWKECEQVCELNRRAPTCRMLKSAMGHLGQNQEVLENAFQEATLREMPRLERFMSTIAVMAAIAPLLGLLGTVNGMINVFRVITAVGTGDPRMMSGGISEALLTTEFGLIVAIPIMIIHHFLGRRVDSIVEDMEQKGTAFAVTMLKNNPSEA